MSNAVENPSNFPTMIIPKGTEIRVNDEGQLSIKTPGNLVIQNSGNYSELESTNGSIRIEPDVKVDAINVRAREACYIEGTLTAWKVTARRISLEDNARAYIMLQESEHMELSADSRLVGNFATEKEIYLLLGKFNNQLRQLPGSVGLDALDAERSAQRRPEPEPAISEPPSREVPKQLRQAVSLMELEMRRADLDSSSRDALKELVYALREYDFKRAQLIYRDAFSELSAPSENLRRAYDLLDSHFRG